MTNTKLRNAYLYAYYECYFQTHFYYKEHKSKNFYSILALGFPIWLLLLFPMTIFFGKKFELGNWMYILLLGIAYGFIFGMSKLVGDSDLTDQINAFYADKKTVKESKMIVLGFVILCILFWVFVINYNGD